MEILAREVAAMGDLEREALEGVLVCGAPTCQPWKQIQ